MKTFKVMILKTTVVSLDTLRNHIVKEEHA